MKKKVIGALLSVAMVASLLVGCGSSASTEEAAAPAATEEAAPAAEAEAEAPAAESNGTKVGVAMPTKDLQRWNQDGENMKKSLEAEGYEVDLQYASNDVATQVSQIENMINGGCNVLVVASIDGSSLGDVMAKAKDAGIPVVAYDRCS